MRAQLNTIQFEMNERAIDCELKLIELIVFSNFLLNGMASIWCGRRRDSEQKHFNRQFGLF